MCFISWVSKHRLINWVLPGRCQFWCSIFFHWTSIHVKQFFSSISKICYLTFLFFSNGSNSSNKINKIIPNIGFHHSWFLNDAELFRRTTTFLIWLDDFSTITNELRFSIDRSPVAKRVRMAIQSIQEFGIQAVVASRIDVIFFNHQVFLTGIVPIDLCVKWY